ncbi:carbohydrate ABC transporter permease [Brachybacterium tyrofermentans]|uniref:carbohydrate ABC transporter permease n=1 Tax=Brachybacterium tyrofermentans TaxID=47848 RepID=UPI003FD41136
MGLLFISPWIIGVAVFVIYPLIYSFVISLTQYSGMQSPTFIGFKNYIAAFADPMVHTSVGNTVYYMLIAVPVGMIVALLLAIAMNRNVREVAIYRTLLYLPSLIPMFAMSFIFIVFVNPQFGIVNQFLGLFGMPDTNLLGEPRYA